MIAHSNVTIPTRIHVTIFGNNLNKKNDPTHTNFQKFLQTRTQNECIYIFSAKILEKRYHHLHLGPYFVDLIFEVEKFNISQYEFFQLMVILFHLSPLLNHYLSVKYKSINILAQASSGVSSVITDL